MQAEARVLAADAPAALSRRRSLLYGTDYKGNVCGSDRSEKLTAYPRLTEDLLVAAEKLGSFDKIASNLGSIDFFGVCVDTCPDLDTYVCTYEAEAMITSSTEKGRRAEIDACKNAGYAASRFTAKCTALYDECWYQGLKTYGYLFRCIPLKEQQTSSSEVCLNPANVPASSTQCRVKQVNSTTSTRTTGQDTTIYDQMTSSVYMWGQYFGDLMTTWYVVLVAGVIGCTALSFLFIYLLKFFAGCIVRAMQAMGGLMPAWHCALTLFPPPVCVSGLGHHPPHRPTHGHAGAAVRHPRRPHRLGHGHVSGRRGARNKRRFIPNGVVATHVHTS